AGLWAARKMPRSARGAAAWPRDRTEARGLQEDLRGRAASRQGPSSRAGPPEAMATSRAAPRREEVWAVDRRGKARATQRSAPAAPRRRTRRARRPPLLLARIEPGR